VTILPQLERDLFNAAQERLRPATTPPHGRPSPPPSWVRARLGRAAAGLPAILSVAVAIAVAVIAVVVLGHGHVAGRRATASGASGGSSRTELIRALGVLRQIQTKADLDGLERAYPRPDTIVSPPTRYPYRMDRRLARVVRIPAWRAEVLIAPVRFESSPTSGGPEGVLLSGWWAGDTFPLPGGLIGSPASSVGELLAHGLWGGPVVPGLDVAHGVVRGPDVEDGVLLVPDAVASVQLGRFTLSAQVAGLSTKALNAALATIHGTAAVHDNIAAFQFAIPAYAGRRPHWLRPGPGLLGAHWPGPGPAPKFWFPAMGATVQDTWYDSSGRLLRRTTTEIAVTMRVQMAPAANH
jgi:hypothetical protein